MSFMKSKKRLILEYLLIAMVVVIGGTVTALWWNKKQVEHKLTQTELQLQTVKNRVDSLEYLTSRQEETIQQLSKAREKDADALGGLLDDYRAFTESDYHMRQRLDSLETKNEEVRDYYIQPIPRQLACLLDPQACREGSQAGTGVLERGTPGSSGEALH